METPPAIRDDAFLDYATTTITNHDQRRAAAATWCGEPHVPERVAATCKELAEDGVTEFSDLRAAAPDTGKKINANWGSCCRACLPKGKL